MSSDQRPSKAPASAVRWRLVVALVAAATFLVGISGALDRFDDALYDAGLRLWDRSVPENVVIVGVDDASLTQYGRWPWSRHLQAELIESLAGAKGVLYDVLLTEPDRSDPTADAALARAIARHGRVALPLLQVIGPTGSFDALLPVSPIAEAAAALGHIQSEIDGDGVVRAAYLYEGTGARLWPQIALAVLRLADPRHRIEVPGGKRSASVRGDWVRERPLLIPFLGPPGHFRRISAAAVLDGSIPAAEWKDKLVLVGVVAQGFGDSYPTPMSAESQAMPGVEIHANILAALDSGNLTRELPSLPASLIAAALVLGLGWLLPRVPARTGLVLGLAAAAAVVAAAFVGMRAGNLWVPPATAFIGALATYAAWDLHQIARANTLIDQELALLSAHAALPAPGSSTAPARRGLGAHRLEQRIEAVRTAAAQLEASQRFIVQVVSGLPIGVVVIDAGGNVVLANARARAALPAIGENPTSPIAQLLARDLKVPPNWSTVGDAGQGTRQCEVVTNAQRELLLVATPANDPRGTGGGELVTITDITELRIADRQREELLRFVSHDMRSPQASILALLEMGDDRPGGLTDAERLARIGTYARRTLELAEDFVNIARAEAIEPARLATLNLSEVAHEACDEAWAAASAKAITLSRRIADDAWVRGDGSLLRRALVNLLDNAIKFSAAGEEVELALAAEGEWWVIAVRDHGVGIPPDALPHLFKRFARLGQGTTAGGVGLGLALAKTVAEHHGGTIAVESRPGEGSTFALRLPAVPAEPS